MKRIDTYGLKLCAFQAELFKNSAVKEACSSRIFIRRFMNSDLAARMDSPGFYFEATSIPDAFEEINLQYGKTDYGQTKYSPEELYWMGYLYRYWAYISGMSSRQLYKKAKPEELKSLYFPYHSLDPEQAIERILEAKGIGQENDIARGVDIMRRVRNRRKNEASSN